MIRPKGRRISRDKRILNNIGLVKKIVCAYYGTASADDEDLIQSGIVGLIKAVNSYEDGLVTGRFSTYARTCIVSEIAYYKVKASDRLLSQWAHFERIRIRKHAQSLTAILGREPSITEILETWPKSKPPSALAVGRALKPDPKVLLGTHENADTDDEPSSLEVDDEPIEIEDLIDAKRAFEKLTPKQRARLTGREDA